jgi:sigma-B regulation protein RsbU (phosphoserine phosphatase)
LVARRNGTTESISSVAPPLGLIKRVAFTETPIDLNPGDAFLLYTDGLLRWSNDPRQRLSPKELEQMLDHCAPSAEALLRTILMQTAAGNSAKAAPDDLAAIAVRRSTGQ